MKLRLSENYVIDSNDYVGRFAYCDFGYEWAWKV